MTLLYLNLEKNKLPTPIAVLGLGISGEELVKLFKRSSIDFSAWDDRESAREDLKNKDIPFVNFAEAGLDGFKTLIPSAGILPSNPIIQQAIQKGLVIANDVDAFYDASRPTPVIGITGTNGKSTTTALTGHILKSCGIETEIGGNIGVATTGLNHIDNPNGAYVIELSSYQLANINHACFDIAVLLNITPDHINWHGSLENYISAKEKIFSLYPPHTKQTAIIGVDTAKTFEIYQRLCENSYINCIPLSTEKEILGGVYIKNNILVDATIGTPEIIASCADFKILRGAHNHQNIMASYAIAKTFGLRKKQILDAIHSFQGLAHRQEFILKKNNILFINDSKATNFDATEKALKAYDNIHLILGGKPKEGGINGIEQYKNKIAHAYLIGEASDAFARTLSKIGIPFTECQTMNNAVLTAYQNTQNKQKENEQVIMLSPACASFDQYKNFEQRGEHFKQLVLALRALP